MNPILDLDVSNRAYLFDKTSIRLGLPRFYVEKDFWVVFILHYLFQESPYRSSFLFKGGTCLSKCYDAIHRFSEDVDISTNWDLLEYSKEGPLKERTRSQRKKFTLLPPPERIPELKADLLAMKDMFYGPVVPIEKVFEQLQLSEKDFASLPLS